MVLLTSRFNSVFDAFCCNLREVWEPKEVASPFEGVRGGTREEIKIRISGHSDSLKNDHGTGEEGKVVRNTEGEDEEDLVELITDGHESLVPVCDDSELGRVVVSEVRRVVVQLLKDSEQRIFVHIWKSF